MAGGALSILQASPEPPGAAGAVNRGVHKTPRTGMRLQQGARTLCFFVGYTSRAKEGEKEPYWEEEEPPEPLD